MKTPWPLQDQVVWSLAHDFASVCRSDVITDVAIVGGGMAGLAAAQAFHAQGKRVVLVDQYYCGSGASGKSSGFITPNAEISLTEFLRRYDADSARQIWDFIISGVEDIRKNILQYKLECDYTKQDTLVVANSLKDLKELEIEHHNLITFGYKSALYSAAEIRNYIGCDNYVGGVIYEDSFGINGYRYCQAMKKILQNEGATIFEQTPVTALEDHVLITPHARISADYIILCTDRFAPQLDVLTQQVYQAQNFVMVSERLTDEQMRTLFPQNNFMVWDTDLIYTYFRLTGDQRLLVGGGSFYSILASKAWHDYKPIVKKLTTYIRNNFPLLNIEFHHVWPGLIGLSKDIAPIAGRDKDKPFLYYISAAAGLPIAAALGRYSAEHILNGRSDLDSYFSPYRSFPIGGMLQSLIGTKLTFALSNLISKNLT